jgi:hypothetical protein
MCVVLNGSTVPGCGRSTTATKSAERRSTTATCGDSCSSKESTIRLVSRPPHLARRTSSPTCRRMTRLSVKSNYSMRAATAVRTSVRVPTGCVLRARLQQDHRVPRRVQPVGQEVAASFHRSSRRVARAHRNSGNNRVHGGRPGSATDSASAQPKTDTVIVSTDDLLVVAKQ